MTADEELSGWREEWLAKKVAIPEARLTVTRATLPVDMSRAHTEFLDDAIRQMWFRFWKWRERNFLAGLRRQLDDGDVEARGWRMRRRRKMKGGLNV